MVQPDYNKKEVMLNIVYYGAPSSGKKSNLAYLEHKMGGHAGKKKVGGYTIHTLECKPKNMQLANMKVCCLLQTISSEISVGKIVDYFQGIDGVVLVADSRSESASETTDVINSLKEILQKNNCRQSDVSMVFQWNKQDLPGAASPKELNSALNDIGVPAQAACANQENGVLHTLDIILNEICGRLEEQMKTPSMRIPKKKLADILNKSKEKKQESKEASDKLSLSKKWKAKKNAAEKAEQNALEKAQAGAKQENKEDAPKLTMGKKWKTKKSTLDEEKPESKIENKEQTSDSKLSLGKKWKSKKNKEAFEEEPTVEKTKEVLAAKLSLGKKWKSKKTQDSSQEKKAPKKEVTIETTSENGVEKERKEAKAEGEKIKSDISPKKLQLGKKWQEEEIVSSPNEKDKSQDKQVEISPLNAKPQEIPIKAKNETNLKPCKKLNKKGIAKPKLDIAAITKNSEPKDNSENLARPAEKNLPKTSTEQAITKLLAGQSLENMELDILNLSDNIFEKPVQIIKCRIKQLLAEGCDFKAPVKIEHTTIADMLNFSGEISSLFREQITFKDVNISGNVNLEGCIFNKGLVIEDSTITSMLKMQGIVCEEKFSILASKIFGISCQDSQFRGNTTISGGQFENIAGFQKCAFYGPLTINSSNFQRAHFMDAYCKGHLELARCIFEKSGNFGRIQCEDGISLEGCVFNGVFNLGEAYLKGRSRFRRTEFCNDASFSKLLASGSMTWEKVSFASLADFSAAHFAQTEMLQNTFYGICNFQESIFTEIFSLLDCVFEQPVYFSRAVFLNRVDLRMSQWKKVSFANIIGDYISINREQVEGKLLAEYQKEQDVAEQEYLTLKIIFSRQRQLEDSDWAHYHAKRAARKKQKFSVLRPLNSLHKILEWLFLDLGCKYGTKPFGLLIVSLFFIAIFAGVYASQFSVQLNLPQGQQKWIQAGWQSVIAFTPFGIMHWKGVDIVIPFSRASLLNILLVIENLLGSFLLLLFVSTFSRKLLQD